MKIFLMLIITISLQGEVCKLRKENLVKSTYIETVCIDKYEYIRGNSVYTQKFKNSGGHLEVIPCKCVTKKQKGQF